MTVQDEKGFFQYPLERGIGRNCRNSPPDGLGDYSWAGHPDRDRKQGPRIGIVLEQSREQAQQLMPCLDLDSDGNER